MSISYKLIKKYLPFKHQIAAKWRIRTWDNFLHANIRFMIPDLPLSSLHITVRTFHDFLLRVIDFKFFLKILYLLDAAYQLAHIIWTIYDVCHIIWPI